MAKKGDQKYIQPVKKTPTYRPKQDSATVGTFGNRGQAAADAIMNARKPAASASKPSNSGGSSGSSGSSSSSSKPFNTMNPAEQVNAIMASGGQNSPIYQELNAKSSMSKSGSGSAAQFQAVPTVNTSGAMAQYLQTSQATTTAAPSNIVANSTMNPAYVAPVTPAPGTIDNTKYMMNQTTPAIFSLGNIGGQISAATTKTAISKLFQVGKTGLPDSSLTNTGKIGAESVKAVNSWTAKKTATWFSKLAAATTNPAFVVGTLMGTIGSYPFAGFIKEEALQTLGFATSTAINNKDYESARLAIQQTEEVLDNGLWEQIKAGVPFVNVITSLDDFYEAAKLKNAIDKKIIDNKEAQQLEGLSNDQLAKKTAQEEADSYKANIDYYNSERKKLLEWEYAAQAANREQEAAFWRAERERQSQLEAADREATAAFWEAYRKQMQKQEDDNRPSKLNFGIL